ncbi:MAG: biotin/lipoate A/B protein ligase family protein [Victivallaceae bacterium]
MTDSGKWFLWLDEKRSPYLNMSIDELLLTDSASTGAPVVRFYGWDRPAVSIGYVQSYDAAPHHTHTVVRRPTGGGVVYHNHDLTYTVVIPAGHQICELDRTESYHVFHRAIQCALGEFGVQASLSSSESAPVDRATMQCFVTPTRYDVVGNGKKYAGAAQRRTRDGILHQGSIDLAVADGNRELLIEKLITALQTQFAIEFIEFNVSKSLFDRATALAGTKYSTEEWNKHKHLVN